MERRAPCDGLSPGSAKTVISAVLILHEQAELVGDELAGVDRPTTTATSTTTPARRGGRDRVQDGLFVRQVGEIRHFQPHQCGQLRLYTPDAPRPSAQVDAVDQLLGVVLIWITTTTQNGVARLQELVRPLGAHGQAAHDRTIADQHDPAQPTSVRPPAVGRATPDISLRPLQANLAERLAGRLERIGGAPEIGVASAPRPLDDGCEAVFGSVHRFASQDAAGVGHDQRDRQSAATLFDCPARVVYDVSCVCCPKLPSVGHLWLHFHEGLGGS